MKFLQLTSTREGVPRPVWVNAALIARMFSNEGGGTAIHLALIDEKGTLMKMNVQETPEQIVAAAQG